MTARRRLLVACAAAALLAAGCGDDSSSDSKQSSTPAAKKSDANLGPVKSYLTDHTEALTSQTAVLKEKGQAYYDIVKGEDFDYGAVLDKHGDEVDAAARRLEGTRSARPTRTTSRWRGSWPAWCASRSTT